MAGMMPGMMQPTILLLREGTEAEQGTGHIISNINACQIIVDIVKTTLGPRGMDKLIKSSRGKATITNDGATVMKMLDVAHPAAQTLVDIAKSQDDTIGDGTTSVVVLAGEFLKAAKPFLEEGMHPQNIIRGYRLGAQLAVQRIKELSVNVNRTDPAAKRDLLMKCAMTTLNSKLIRSHSPFFAAMVVDAVFHLDDTLSLQDIGIKKQKGGGLQDSIYVEGVAFKKTFSYAGFEQQPKKFNGAIVLALNLELELKAEKDNAEIRVTDPDEYQSMVDAEWKVIYEKLDKIAKCGANVVLSRLAIGDLATQYFADRGIFCAGRVPEDDLKRTCHATGASVQSSVNNLVPEVLGHCDLFEERQVGNERYNFFSGCPGSKTVTIILRGGAEQFIEEAERSLHDAIMIVRRTMKSSQVVAGGGAIEMELSRYLLEKSDTIQGRQQLIVRAMAKALEVIPRTLCENAGFDSTDLLNKLRNKHSNEVNWFGVDMNEEGICDTFERFVWEPAMVKLNAIHAAAEAACMILSVDETVKNPKSEQAKVDPQTGQAMTQKEMDQRNMRQQMRARGMM